MGKKNVFTLALWLHLDECMYKRHGASVLTEYRFHPERKWPFDMAIPAYKIAIEIEGGTWINGRHVTGGGYADDCEKYNAAAVRGWAVLRYTTEQAQNINQIVADIEEAMKR